ncbi:MAG: acyltransferase [Terrimicrobiaceae bacterium]|nr:acyltransferase [Terrimicrobiaceae bacterium]
MSAFAPAASAAAVVPEPIVPRKKGGYQPQLDGLRGIAILSVLLHHFEVRLPGLFDWGPIGVRIFFLLSGYLITQSLWRLQAEAREAGGGYWSGLISFHTRRMARLMPVLYTMIGVACLMGLPEFRNAFEWHIAFLSNFYALNVGKWPDAASHLWSLSVQEQFYLVWPFVLLLTPRRVLPYLLAALFAEAFVFRAWVIGSGASDFYRWVMLPGVFDSFALGALIACWKKSGPSLAITRGWLGAAIGVAALGCYILARIVRFGPFGGPWVAVIETLENIFLGWLLLRTAAGWRGMLGRLFENPVLVYFGRISYGLYVFHVLVHVALTPWLAHHSLGIADHVLLRSAILLAVSVGVASLSYYYVEAPLSAWVRRRETPMAGVPVSAA